MTDTASTPPSSDNPIVGAADNIVEALENILVPIAENVIISYLPELGLPVVKQITEAIEQGIADKLTALAEQGVTFAVVDTQVTVEKFTISYALMKLIEAEKSGDPNAIKQAMDDYANAQSQLLSASGTVKH
jgi:hypothetical protein